MNKELVNTLQSISDAEAEFYRNSSSPITQHAKNSGIEFYKTILNIHGIQDNTKDLKDIQEDCRSNIQDLLKGIESDLTDKKIDSRFVLTRENIETLNDQEKARLKDVILHSKHISQSKKDELLSQI